MPEYLETTSDKFTFRVATDRLYSADGVWFLPIQPENANRVRVGLTDFMQQRSGDVAFVSVKAPGTPLEGGDDLAELETVKVTRGIPTPVGGTVIEVNGALDVTPEVVNADPYGEGWLAVIEARNWKADRATLLDPRAYLAVVRSQVELELENR